MSRTPAAFSHSDNPQHDDVLTPGEYRIQEAVEQAAEAVQNYANKRYETAKSPEDAINKLIEEMAGAVEVSKSEAWENDAANIFTAVAFIASLKTKSLNTKIITETTGKDDYYDIIVLEHNNSRINIPKPILNHNFIGLVTKLKDQHNKHVEPRREHNRDYEENIDTVIGNSATIYAEIAELSNGLDLNKILRLTYPTQEGNNNYYVRAKKLVEDCKNSASSTDLFTLAKRRHNAIAELEGEPADWKEVPSEE